MTETSPVTLSEEECWAFLGSEELGRLAFRLVDEVHITPINFAVSGRALLFRTAPGEKLLASAMESSVAFEVDRIEQDSATSVVVRGRARILDEAEAHRADDLSLQTWVDSLKYEVIEIVPEHVSGRTYRLNRTSGS